MNGNNVCIVQSEDKSTRIFIDDIEITNVIGISYKNNVEDIPKITLTFIPRSLNVEKSKILY